MPAFLEKKLKKRYGAKSKVPYKIMNKLGYMHGNKETSKGKAAERKHNRDKGKSKGKLSSKAVSRRISGAHRYGRSG